MSDKVDVQPETDGTTALTTSTAPPWLNPWKKGQSGNPGGKSKKLEEVKSLAKQASPRAMQRLVELIESDDERVALMAAEKVLERAWGKPKEADDDSAGKNLTINIVKFSDGNQPSKQLESTAVSVRTLAVS